MSSKIVVKLPKSRKPIAQKSNTVMKSKRDYSRKIKHKNKSENS